MKDFFGAGSSFTVDSAKPMTVVTQFITDDGTDTGTLVEIRRLYVQGGKVINSPSFDLAGKQYDSITDEFCTAEAAAFNDDNAHFVKNGGLAKMGKAMESGLVLVLSLWDDAVTKMQWLDSDFPADQAGQPGFHRGPCSVDAGAPGDLINNHADATVKFSSIKFGEIGSTYSGTPGPTPAPTPAPAPTPTPTPAPTPSDCPGGSLMACIALCPSTPPVVYSACVSSCATRCT